MQPIEATAGHTPGPWNASAVTSADSLIYYRIDAGKNRIGFAGTYLDHQKRGVKHRLEQAEATANARLIAAAPDLLEALKAVELARHSDAPEDWLRATGLSAAAILRATQPTE